MQDAQEVMGMLVKVQSEQGDMEPDDPQVRAIYQSLQNSCSHTLCINITMIANNYY